MLARSSIASALLVAALAAVCTSLGRAGSLPALGASPSRQAAVGSVQDPVLDRARTLAEEARAAKASKDAQGARAKAAEAIEALLSEDGGAESEARIALLFDLGRFAQDAGDLRAAERARRRVLEVRSRTLPEEHPDLQAARQGLAVTIWSLGDLAGARALQEQVLEVESRTLPEEHTDLQVARGNLAATLFAQGDLAGARVLLEQVLEVFSRTLPAEHPDVQKVRANLAVTIKGLGDLAGARTLQEQVLEVCSRTLPDDHRDVQAARLNLAGTLYSLGDLGGARAMLEQVVEAFSRTLPADHPDLQTARGNLAATTLALGDLADARALYEQVLEVRSRTLPDDHPDVQMARQGLAVTLKALGDLTGARALYEHVLEVRSRTLPAEHADVQRVRGNLAVTLKALGDLAGARALQEQVLEVYSRTLPGDHPDLQTARQNLAAAMYALGDLAGARALLEQVLEVYSRTLPEDHPDLQAARGNLAATLRGLGDLADARALFEQVLEVRSRTMPIDHPDVQATRANLALTIEELGDPAGARALQEQVLEVYSRTLPEDHPELQKARGNLAFTIAALAVGGRGGDETRERERFAELARAHAAGLAQAARATLLGAGSREAEERCANLLPEVGNALSFAAGLGVFPPDPELEPEVFALCETTRGAALASASLARLASDDGRYAELRGALRAASDEVARLARSGGSPDALDAALAERDAAQRELLARARVLSGVGADRVELDPGALAASLSEDAAVIAYRRYSRRASSATSTDSLCAFVVRRGRGVARVELGSIAPIQGAAMRWRDLLSTPPERSAQVVAIEEHSSRERSAGEELRRLVFDPLLSALDGAERLVVVPDDVLHAVPLDAMPVDASSRDVLGERFAVEERLTLCGIPREDERARAAETLLALGAAAFGSEPLPHEAEDVAALEVEEPEVASLLRGGAWERGFAPLIHTGSEARGIAALHAEVFGERAPALVLEERKASRASIEELAPRARWLHLATHGWFAPESIRSWEDLGPLDRLSSLGLRTSAEERVKGASPMVLCGLALAGANLPADEIGRYPGLVTAEEISSWDLSRCELAVLSACDTNVGLRRAGQGVASLQKALHMAGARSVITSLWKVPDEATKELMLAFYRRLWVKDEPKGRALWDAKMELRDARDGLGRLRYSTCDWAAWVLTGEPR